MVAQESALTWDENCEFIALARVSAEDNFIIALGAEAAGSQANEAV